MKNLLLVTFLLILVSCNSEETGKSSQVKTEKMPTGVQTQPVAKAQSANSGIPHYYCPSNCSGGVGDAAGACPVCGTEMTHNEKFHANDAAKETQPEQTQQPQQAGKSKSELPMTEVSTRLASGRTFDQVMNDVDSEMRSKAGKGAAQVPQSAAQVPQAVSPGIPPSAEPPQNAAGVWHFTCPQGCAGGSGSGAACASCGTTLVHNAAYH